MVNNDFIYKTMEEMKPSPRLQVAHRCGSIRRYYATEIIATKVVVIVIVVFIACFNTGLCCLRLLGERFLDRF